MKSSNSLSEYPLVFRKKDNKVIISYKDIEIASLFIEDYDDENGKYFYLTFKVHDEIDEVRKDMDYSNIACVYLNFKKEIENNENNNDNNNDDLFSEI